MAVPQPDAPDRGNAAAEIDTALAGRPHWPPALDSLFEASRGQARRARLARAIAITGLLVLLVAGLDAVNDLTLMAAALPWRLALLALCGVCAGLLLRSDTNRLWRAAEPALVAVPLLAIMVATQICGEYAGRMGDRYMIAAAVTVGGFCAVTPVTLGTARLICACAAVIYPATLALLPLAVPLHGNWDLPLFATGVLGTALLISKRNDISRRTGFLYRRRHEISAAELNMMNAELLRLAETDALTGLRNRRAFSAALAHHWQDRRQGFGVALIDVDWFKAFNDSAGHAAGDAALQAVAAAITRTVRDRDLAARYGGEEFAVLMPGIDQAELQQAGERLRATVASLALPHPGRPAELLSISVGLAWCGSASRFATTPDLLMRAADTALYAAKAQGRDRVVLQNQTDIATTLRGVMPVPARHAGA